MKQRSIKIFFSLLLAVVAFANKGNAQYFSTDTRVEELFVYQVKGIDEFMERFNDEKTSFIRKEYERQNKPYNISRSRLLISLFNTSHNWINDSGLLREFCMNVVNEKQPQTLVFEDDNWYAEVRCVFLHNKKKAEIPVLLHISKDQNNGLKWMIAGIGVNTILNDTGKVKIPEHDQNKAMRFISPNSYATNFVALYNVFTDSMQPGYFFEPQAINSVNGKQFIELILGRKVSYQYVKNVKYHFCQVPEWVFTVEEFTRTEFNSGWLINGLIKANDQEKAAFKKRLLHL